MVAGGTDLAAVAFSSSDTLLGIRENPTHRVDGYAGFLGEQFLPRSTRQPAHVVGTRRSLGLSNEPETGLYKPSPQFEFSKGILFVHQQALDTWDRVGGKELVSAERAGESNEKGADGHRKISSRRLPHRLGWRRAAREVPGSL